MIFTWKCVTYETCAKDEKYVVRRQKTFTNRMCNWFNIEINFLNNFYFIFCRTANAPEQPFCPICNQKFATGTPGSVVNEHANTHFGGSMVRLYTPSVLTHFYTIHCSFCLQFLCPLQYIFIIDLHPNTQKSIFQAVI